MKQAIVNLINAIADRIRPCKHKWVEFAEWKTYDTNTNNTLSLERMYCCSECSKMTKVEFSV